MIENFKNIMNNVIDRLIVMGECCQTPRFLDNYLSTIPDLSGYPNIKLSADSREKKMLRSGADSKTARSEEDPALSGNVLADKILAAK